MNLLGEFPPGSRAWDDVPSLRKAVFDSVFEKLQQWPVVEDDTVRLELSNLRYIDPSDPGPDDEKQAVLNRETLARRLVGTWRLVDKQTGQVLGQRSQVVVRVPYISSTGTVIDRGTKYSIINQSRIRPGVYHHVNRAGLLESHVNILPGQGISHRIQLDPENAKFRIVVGQAMLPLYPVLRAMGATDEEISAAWGKRIFEANRKYDPRVVKKALEKFKSFRVSVDESLSDEEKLRQYLENHRLDPWVMQRTTGIAADHVTKDVYLLSTAKLLRIQKGQEEPDDRDHLAFQKIIGPEDILAESINYDPGGWRRRVLRRVLYERDLSKMPSGLFTPSLETALYSSQLAQAVEETNITDEVDRLFRVTRMGRGGIPSYEAIPDEARSVQPSHFGFLDFVRTTDNGERVGVDVFFSTASRKGKDGKVYSPFFSRKENRIVWVTPEDVYDSTVASFDSFASDMPRIPVLFRSKIVYRRPEEVDYVVPSEDRLFTLHTAIVPFVNSNHIHRLSMGTRYLTQAVPLKEPESPLVLPEYSKESFKRVSSMAGAIFSPKNGIVRSVSPKHVEVQYDDGQVQTFPLYVNYPANRLTFLHQTPVVQPGQRVAAGDLLVRSNQTDANGRLALGRNLYTAYMSYYGYNFKDAVVLSESAAKKLASETMFQEQLEVSPNHRFGKKNYLALFGSRFSKDQFDRIGADGVVKPGTVLQKGDPIILAVRQREDALNRVHKKGQPTFIDDSLIWERDDPGEVVETVWSKEGPVVLIRSVIPVREGDKISGLHGDKGVVSLILPDDQMPKDEKGVPFEVLLSPLSVVSRTNPGQVFEGWAGLVADATGQPVYVPGFNRKSNVEWVAEQLKKHGISPIQSVYEPVLGTKVPGVAVGKRYLMRLVHIAEDKSQGRAGGGYTSEGLPAKSGDSKAKRLALMDVNALLAHGAYEVLRDSRMARGQRNDVLWSQFMQGNIPEPNQMPLVYKKFLAQLEAAGVRVLPLDKHRIQLMALTNQDVHELSENRVLRNAETVEFSDRMQPFPGGLFDPSMTGGHHGELWSAIELPEPMPNPVMEDPIRYLLDLTKQEYLDVLSGKRSLGKYGSGPMAIKKALEAIDPQKEYKSQLSLYGKASASKKREILRKLGYLRTAVRLGMKPSDWIWDRVPVIPPVFRPVSKLQGKQIPLVADANYLYKELWESIDVFNQLKGQLPDEQLTDERKSIYLAMKAITGLGDPITAKNQTRNVSGFLRQVLGDSPKFGTVQQKLLGTTVDNVGRSVIVPDPDYGLDEVGIPERAAFDLYGRYIVRRLRRRGLPVSEAIRHWRDRTALARSAIEEEMRERPIIASRAPVLHKFGILAFWPRLVKGSVMRVNPFVLKGFNADFDGDTMTFHVPMSPRAVEEAIQLLLPSKNLIAVRELRRPAAAPIEEDLLAGLYSLTEPPPENAQPKYFRTKRDALAAWYAGQLRVNDPVVIINE